MLNSDRWLIGGLIIFMLIAAPYLLIYVGLGWDWRVLGSGLAVGILHKLIFGPRASRIPPVPNERDDAYLETRSGA